MRGPPMLHVDEQIALHTFASGLRSEVSPFWMLFCKDAAAPAAPAPKDRKRTGSGAAARNAALPQAPRTAAVHAAQSLLLAGVLLTGVPALAVNNDGNLGASSQWQITSTDILTSVPGGALQSGRNLTGKLTLSPGIVVSTTITGQGSTTFTSGSGYTGLSVVSDHPGVNLTLGIGGSYPTILDTGGDIDISGSDGGTAKVHINGVTANSTLKGTTTVGTAGTLDMSSATNGTATATHTGNVTVAGTLSVWGGASGKANTIEGNLSVSQGGTVDLTNRFVGTKNTSNYLLVTGNVELNATTSDGTNITVGDGTKISQVTTKGTTSINGGTLTVNGGSSYFAEGGMTLGSANTSTLALKGGGMVVGDVALDGIKSAIAVSGGTEAMHNLIDGNLTVTQGNVQFSDPIVTYLKVTGTTLLEGGSISVGGGNVAHVFIAAAATSITGGTLTLNSDATYMANGGMTLSGSKTAEVQLHNARVEGNVTLNGDAAANAALIVQDGAATPNTLGGDLTVTRGTLTLGSMDKAGAITSPGFLKLDNGKNASFGAASVVNTYVANNVLQGTGTLSVADGAKLNISGGTAGTYTITSGFTGGVVDANAWLGDNLTSVSSALKATGAWLDNNYVLTLRVDSVQPQFPLMQGALAGLASATLMQEGFSPDSPNAGVRFISRAASNQYLGENQSTLATATLEGAAQTGAVGATQGATLSAQKAGASAVVARTSFANPLGDMQGGAMALNEDGITQSGLSAGSAPQNGLGLWVMPLWQSDHVFGMKSGSFKTGYTSNLGGVAVGADYTVANAFRFGAAFNLGGGYASSGGDFNATNNNFNFWGIAAYAGWTHNNIGLTADLGYSGTYSKVRQETPAAMNFGDLKSDINSGVFSTGLRAEYQWETSVMDIIPHVGVRYSGLTTRGHSVKGGGGTVFDVAQSEQSLWTFPLGVTLSKSLETGSGWTVRPLLDLGLIPASGDVESKSRVRVPGVDARADMKTQVADYLTFDGTAGVELKNNNITLGLNYNLQASEHRTGQGLFGTFRYEF